MSADWTGRTFVDTNVVLYLLSKDPAKAQRARDIVSGQPIISVQVLNEITNVARRKLDLGWKGIDEFLTLLRALCPVEPITEQTHDLGRRISERYQLSVYDGQIVASALGAGCDVLYSEDMQPGLRIERTLTVVNPFVGDSAPDWR